MLIEEPDSAVTSGWWPVRGEPAMGFAHGGKSRICRMFLISKQW